MIGDRVNRNGTAYALTVFTAITHGHERDVARTIAEVARGKDSPFARVPQLHTSRLQIFDRLAFQGGGQRPDQLRNDYLVFTAAFDGELDDFLNAIANLLPHDADSWWRHCVGYPGTTDRAALRRWIRHNQVATTLFAVASPNRSVADVIESLAVRERLLEFAISAQGLDAVELQHCFRHAFADLGTSTRRAANTHGAT